MRRERENVSSEYLVQSDEVEKETLTKEDILSEENVIMVLAVAAILHFGLVMIRYVIAIAVLDNRIISNNVLYMIMFSIGPIIAWLLSTKTEFWNFHNRKIALFYIVILNFIAVWLQPLYTLLWKIIVPNVFKITPTAALTQGMIILLCQLLLAAGVIGVISVVMIMVHPVLLSERGIEKIKHFKIMHHIDDRDNKEHAYDIVIAKDLETAKDIVIKMSDRFVHVLINGASGTGKTSSVFLPAIAHDLDVKLKNYIERVKLLIGMLVKKKAYVKGSISKWDEYKIFPKEGNEKEFEDIYQKFPDCGITVVAPNNSIVKKILKLADARNLTVNVLDPASEYNKSDYCKYKSYNKVSLSPFYVPYGLPEKEKSIWIRSTADVFADVLVAVNERNGASEVYFTDITRSVCTNIAVVAMLARNIQGRQTDIVEIQQCMSNIADLEPLVEIIERHYNIKVEVSNKKTDKTDSMASAERLMKAGSMPNIGDITDARKRAKENEYYNTLVFVKTELLGAGSDKMFDQARGLRNLMDKFLGDPRIREVLIAPEDDRLDFDEALAKNQITVINTALEYGEEKSTALGLFSLLNFKVAALRRPGEEDTRSPHFLWIDEAPQYMHAVFETFIALLRQYRVSVNFAVQGLEQFEKNNMTKYLKGVFMKVGTHFVFGRLNTDEMETYSKLSGEFEQDVAQNTISETSILSDNPTVSKSVRTTPTMKAKIDGTSMRLVDFQEVTILTIDKGRVLEGKYAKVHFLRKKDFKKRKKFTVDWDTLKEKVEISMQDELENEEKVYNEKETSEKSSNATDDFLDSMSISRVPEWMKEQPRINQQMVRPEAQHVSMDYGNVVLPELNIEISMPQVEMEDAVDDTTLQNDENDADEEGLCWYEIFGKGM